MSCNVCDHPLEGHTDWQNADVSACPDCPGGLCDIDAPRQPLLGLI